MRILIDECLNWRLSRALKGHFAVSAQKMGWAGIKNGKLLALAVENKFDVFLTGDRNLAFQQNISEFAIAIVILENERGAIGPNAAGDSKNAGSASIPSARHNHTCV